jgi:eukaryotic-like serine/threonine-protein kinase
MPGALTDEQWECLSDWFNRWLTADDVGRERLRAEWRAEAPDLIGEAEALTAGSLRLPDFLETPALLLEARALAREDLRFPSGTLIGPYLVTDLLGRGGMGDVYRATDTRLGRDIALKVLAATKTGDPQRLERFLHEARVTASIDHANVLRVYDVGRAAGTAYLVSELLDGETLRARIERGSMPAGEVRAIGRQIASGLAAAHAAGLVHRDLKPENVFLTRTGTVKLLDFGIAKLTQDDGVQDGFSTLTGAVLGTAGYLAPEQIRGGPIDTRADLFGFGSVLCEMLTGTRAFARDHLVETLHAILHDPPSPALQAKAAVEPRLAAITTRLLEKSPEARFQSALEVIESLDAADPSPQMRSSAAGTRKGIALGRAFTRRRVSGALVTAVLIAGIGWYRAMAPDPSHPVTLAVLPFHTIPAGGHELLNAGLADVFVSRLGQIAGLRVLPLTATQRLQDDSAQTARRLSADWVLSVTLQVDGSLVRATPELFSAAAGRTTWTTTVDAEAATLFNIQDIIVTRVIAELAPMLSAESRRSLAGAGTRHGGAYDAYLRGRAEVLRPTRAELLRAVTAFESAVALDADFADAWAGLAAAYRRMPIGGDGRADWLVKAKSAAEHALTLAPEHPDALSTLGTVAFWYKWDYGRAEQLLRRAADLQPSSADLAVSLAHLLSSLGRHEEALTEIRRARALDPAGAVARALEGQFLFMARRFASSLDALDVVVRAEPRFATGHVMRTYPLLALGQYDEAIRACDQAIALRRALDPDERLYPWCEALTGYALARSGRHSEAEEHLALLQNEARTAGADGTYSTPYGEALVLHALGRDDEALQRLADAVDRREHRVTFLGVDPKWDALRGTPGFDNLLSRANLLHLPAGR